MKPSIEERVEALELWIGVLSAKTLLPKAPIDAKLPPPICIGRPIIGHLARDGQWISESGAGVIAADELFHNDPYDRITELERQLEQVRGYLADGENSFRRLAGEKAEEVAELKRQLTDAQAVIRAWHRLFCTEGRPETPEECRARWEGETFLQGVSYRVINEELHRQLDLTKADAQGRIIELQGRIAALIK